MTTFSRQHHNHDQEAENIFSLVFGADKASVISDFKDFECRPQQIKMTKAVMNSLKDKRHLLVEAGTGTGKSMAYLLAVIRSCVKDNIRVVISTETKTLQEQLVKKDLPRLKKMLDLEFQYALCVGSQNFLCLRRFRKNDQPSLMRDEESHQLNKILAWVENTRSGLITDLLFQPIWSLWSTINRDGDLCLRKKCPCFSDCFYYKNRKELRDASILIVNHHLFFSHISSGGKILPDFQSVIFDEAHTLENTASSFLGEHAANFQMDYLLNSFFNPVSGKGILRGVKGFSQAQFEHGRALLDDVKNAADQFFSKVILHFQKDEKTWREGKIRLRGKNLFSNEIEASVMVLCDFLADLMIQVQSKEDEMELISFISKLKTSMDTLNSILNLTKSQYVYWLEIEKRKRGTRCSFHSCPLDISGIFNEKVLERIQPSIFVSATLSVDGNFSYFKKALGIDTDARELILDSPFNFRRNAVIYTPKSMPDPSDVNSGFAAAAIEETGNIIKAMQGRTLVLYTSYSSLFQAARIFQKKFEGIRVLCQGEMPRFRLIREFKKNNNTILLATSTFWQGIDIPGKDLECVVICKLPFAVPDDPVAEAKMDLLKIQGKNPFHHYQMPRAIIMMRQGFGRLIRSQKDKGIVAILDPRIRIKNYGHKFIEALPSCDIVLDFQKAMEINGVRSPEPRNGKLFKQFTLQRKSAL